MTHTAYNLLPKSTTSKTSLNLNYNYPSLNRKDTMYLSTMTQRDFPIKKFKQLQTNRDWSINLYNLDIEGSSPRKFGAFHQKIDYTNKNDDIEKSSPKKLILTLKKPVHNLSNSDIDFSHPNCVKTKIKRHLNPLEPKYILPTSPQYPPYDPKFIKDNINVDDIEGSKPGKVLGGIKSRDIMKIDDVKDSWPKRPYIRKSKYEYIDYTDVTNTEFKSKRNTNPLDPFYTMKFVDGSKNKFGPIEKSKPQTGYQYIFKVPFNLKVDDIEGSNIGSKNKMKNYRSKNFCYDISDIKGSKSGTLLKGIYTERRTNPLCPKYKYLGSEELKGFYENNPYDNNNKHNNNNFENNISINRSKSMKNNLKKSDINDINKEENKKSGKILDKNLKIINNDKISLGPKDKTENNKFKKPDFNNIPFIEDKVEFDKDKYKKPEINYSIIHDKYLIPPIENHKRNKVNKINIDIRALKEKRYENAKYNKKSTDNKFLTYANKLDNFMTSTNYKFNMDFNTNNSRNVAHFAQTGLPKEFLKNQESSKNIDEINHNN